MAFNAEERFVCICLVPRDFQHDTLGSPVVEMVDGREGFVFQHESAVGEAEAGETVVVGRDLAEVLGTGNLGDVAATVLDVMGIEKPADMTAHSLIKH